MKRGYYLIYLKIYGNKPDKTFGYHDGSNDYPWSVIGSDEIFHEKDVEVIKKIDIDNL